ncbi:MAG: hypothetical protein AAGI09_10895 [Pseudomonadota bacterium]
MEVPVFDCHSPMGPLQYMLSDESGSGCLSLTLTLLQSTVVCAALITALHVAASLRETARHRTIRADNPDPANRQKS